MQTMPIYERNQLESEILRYICVNPACLSDFTFWLSDFMEPQNKKTFAAMLALKEINQEISIISLSETVLASELTKLFTNEEVFNIVGPLGFTVAARRLREDTIRHLIIRKLETCSNSLEYLKFTQEVANASLTHNLQTFEKDFEEYEKEYLQVEAQIAKGEAIGLITEWSNFNQKISLMPNDFVVIGARTSIGKTAFALNLAIQAASNKQKVLFISMEMARQSIFDRLFANIIRRNSWDFKIARVNMDLIKREMQAIKDHFFFVHAPTATTDLVASLSAKSHFDLIVVDYLQLLKDRTNKGETENLRLGRISSKLKQIAGENKCVVVSPAQLNRDSEKGKREPNLSDLRDSGCIEQDADAVLLLHREDRESTKARIIIAKNRNGAVGFINFAYLPSQNLFDECADQTLDF